MRLRMAETRPAFARYGFALAIVVAATALRLLLDTAFGNHVPYITYFVAVVLAAWFGGVGPAVMALLLGAAAAAYFFINPRHTLDIAGFGEILGLALYLALGAIILALVQSVRAAHRQAEERREWLRVTLASIGDAVIATDSQGRVAFINGVAETLTGWPGADAQGRSLDEVFRIISEQTRQTVESPVERVLREGVIVGLANHTLLIDRAGAEHPIADSAAPIRDARGAVIGVVLVFRDITERRRADLALRASEQRFRLAAEAFSGFIYDWDPDTGAVVRSSGLTGLLGYEPAECGDSRWWGSLVPPEDLERARDAVRAAMDGGAAHYAVEYRVRHKDGTLLDLWDRGLIVRDERGQPVRVVGTTMDITERRRAEQEARAAREAAEVASQAKDAFIAALSHELRTPLTPVLMAVSALRDDPRLPDDLRDALGKVHRNVALEVRLIDDLLDLTGLARGKLELAVAPVDIHAVLREAAEICRSDVSGRGLALRLDLGAARPTVPGDAARLRQVFWNLLKNAAKFTAGGGTIIVATEDRPDGRLRVRVTDTGAGIAPEDLERIFNAFEQTADRPAGGLGLGLAIARAVVAAHGGTIAARSEGPGQGATFVIDLPGATASDAPAPSADARDGHAPRPLRILLVDDHADTLATTAMVLRLNGHDVTTADSVRAALAAAEAASFDLFISDLGLPDGTGHDLAERLRPLRGIALSGYGMERDIERGRRAGFRAHLTKPVDIDTLEACIRQVAGAPG
jgi:PAS domain S-box-containing protein